MCSCKHMKNKHQYDNDLRAYMYCKVEGCDCEGYDQFEEEPELDFDEED